VTSFERGFRALDRYQQAHGWAGFPVAVWKKFGDDQGGYLAALIAYYGFFSLFPLMLAFVSVLGIVLANSPDLQDRIIDSAIAQFPVIGPTIADDIHAISGNGLALAVGIIAALWAGLGVVQATQHAMNEVWDVPRTNRPGYAPSRLRSLLMLLILGTAVIASSVLSGFAAVSGAGGDILLASETILALLVNLAVFLLVYRVLASLHLRWGQVLPGAVVAATLWTVLQYVGALYVNHTVQGATNVYGTFALVIGLLVWIYLGGQLTLYCAEINVVWVRRLWPRSLAQPPLTEADHRVFRAEALQARRRPEERVEITFEVDDPPGGSTASTPRDDGP
jgi:YihY family inner membrane protein